MSWSQVGLVAAFMLDPVALIAQRPTPDAPILYSEADARAAICYANSLADVGPHLRADPRPLVLLDGRRAQAVDSTMAHCPPHPERPKWLASVDYLADGSIYGRRAAAGAVLIKSAEYLLGAQRRDSLLKAQRP